MVVTDKEFVVNVGAMCGREVLHLGRNLGVEDKEGIRITQVNPVIISTQYRVIVLVFMLVFFGFSLDLTQILG